MLSLPSTSMPLVLQNPQSQLVSCLPYIDIQNDENLIRQVQKMILDEMKSMPKQDYLENLPVPKCKIIDSEEFQNYSQSIIKGENKNSLNGSIYEFRDHPNDRNNIEQWENLINRAHALKQYDGFKKINLELYQKYGPNKWKQYLNQLEVEKEYLTKRNSDLQFKNSELNAQRKFEQIQWGEKLQHNNDRISELIQKTKILENECYKLENEWINQSKKKMKLA